MNSRPSVFDSLVLPALFLGMIGGGYWSGVRMSNEGCGWTNGLIWGLAWYYLSASCRDDNQRPYGSGWFVLASVVGFYLGGQHGYGQFHSWIQGMFHLNYNDGELVEIPPRLGYWWVFLCGCGWGGVAGVVLSWTGFVRRIPWWQWVARICLVVGVAWAFREFALARMDLIMPLYGQVDYSNLEACPDCACPDCKRTVRTLVESMMWLGFYVGGLIFEVLRRDWNKVGFIVTTGVGFGCAFTAFEWLHLPLFQSGSLWKYWESSCGVLGGVTLGVSFYLFNRPRSDDISTDQRDGSSARWISAAERLIGVWLPLLVSFYVVTKKKSQYYFTWFGMEKNVFMESVDLYLAILLTAIGCVVACQTLWRSGSGLSVPAVPRAGWLFLTSYIAMFLVSRLHSLDGIIDNASQRFEVAPYGVPFVLGMVFFSCISIRRRRYSKNGHSMGDAHDGV